MEQKRNYLVLIFLMMLDIFLTVAFAWFFGALTNAAIKAHFSMMRQLLPEGLGLLVLSLFSHFFGIYIETKTSQGTKKDLKNYLFDHILRLPASETNDRRAGELISHFTTDIHSVDGFLGSELLNLLRLPLIYITVFIYLIHLNGVLCLISIGIAPLAVISSLFFGNVLRRNGHQLFKLYGQLNSLLNETFHGLSVIRSFTLEKMFYQQFRDKNEALFALELENAKLQGFFYTGGSLISSVTFLVSLSTGAYFISKGHMTVGALITFVNLVNHLVYPLTSLAGQWSSFQKAISAIERVLDLLEQPVAYPTLPSYSAQSKNLSKHIEFRHITFSYTENQRLFKNFNLEIPAGKRVAIVGPSGAGKTTLFNLLQGLYDPQMGEVLVGGRPLSSYTISELRSAIAIVPQETFLFAGTIRENLELARPGVSEMEMVQAAKKTSLHSYILSLPEGYETEIGERGVKLSGGQKQRLAIARAILKDAPILLLDEATSALDTQTEHLIQQALNELMADKTTLVIAHRLSTIQEADVIVVIDQGVLVQVGTYEELMNEPGLFKTMNETSYKETALVKMLSQ